MCAAKFRWGRANSLLLDCGRGYLGRRGAQRKSMATPHPPSWVLASLLLLSVPLLCCDNPLNTPEREIALEPSRSSPWGKVRDQPCTRPVELLGGTSRNLVTTWDFSVRTVLQHALRSQQVGHWASAPCMYVVEWPYACLIDGRSMKHTEMRAAFPETWLRYGLSALEWM